MSVQDVLLGAGNIFFVVALVVMVVKRQPAPLYTCLTTSFWLAVFAGVYVSLGLWFAFAATSVSALLWLVGGTQAYRHLRGT